MFHFNDRSFVVHGASIHYSEQLEANFYPWANANANVCSSLNRFVLPLQTSLILVWLNNAQAEQHNTFYCNISRLLT